MLWVKALRFRRQKNALCQGTVLEAAGKTHVLCQATTLVGPQMIANKTGFRTCVRTAVQLSFPDEGMVSPQGFSPWAIVFLPGADFFRDF
jgi:hypothetical protein